MVLPPRVKRAYWKLSSTGGSVKFGGVTSCLERGVSQIQPALTLERWLTQISATRFIALIIQVLVTTIQYRQKHGEISQRSAYSWWL
ncbi:hypothetical protein D3C84_396130 [compost metagenome]